MTHISRRSFLIGLAAVPLAASAGCVVAQSSPPAPGTAPTGKFTRSLPIPPLAASTVDAAGTRHFVLTAGTGHSEVLAGKSTATWGFNGSMLGPTIRARRGEAVAFTIDNALPEPTSVHWHGMHVPARFDGGPHQAIEPGARWEPTWTVNQPGATLWYHPHPHGSTEKHVYRGLAGLFLVDDDVTDAIDLPKDYGVDDIPLIIQDKRFTADGTLDESDPTDVGLLGDTIVTNGIAGAYLPVTTELVRLRILNGSGGRTYNLAFSDDREFQLVATDGGLLSAPTALRRLQLSPGERAEIVVAMRGGSDVVLRSVPADDRGGLDRAAAAQFGFTDTFDIVELRPERTLGPSPAVPSALAPIARLDPSTAVAERDFELQWFMINGARMDMNRIDFSPTVYTTEIWTVRNADNWPHNFHVHDVQFQVLDIDGSPPPAHLAGWKDTVYAPPGRRIRLALRFTEYTDPAVPYMFHCHLLLHEDQGMMGQFLVLEPGATPRPMQMGTSAPTTAGHGGHGG
ncbi:multicopper oxidase family protein [Prescottella equi]|uniref:multicopper oxidase family protein n=1 Tax=Rhodococcus hoagii TaxID=43767 RepID=UPI0009BCB8F1|nr:multicopper oxidase domain-containing protein [Prescottella equi]AVP69470.1 copper oxidase [Prescottella equi]MBM4727497.1 multicopper oxidase domain-containing protein [Prescottella equi]NKR26699.1 multicopper oxidase domain-containing protein [Prescottella equi]NKR40300.1 multicopper oxidase domain-containing protein [Prescottella equi]NKR46923.1 multicopper oxidase domain-containing protein [Prescottella equi]